MSGHRCLPVDRGGEVMDDISRYCGSCGDEIYEDDCMSLECRIKRDGPIHLQELPCLDCAAKDAEIKRLREAVEWAIKRAGEITLLDIVTGEGVTPYIAELRRRIGDKT
jgi:hypothetical protein